MKRSEEELQNQIEKGLVNEFNEDVRAYQQIFDALKKEPDFHVSLPFADRIVAIVEKKEEKQDYFWMAAGILLIVITLIVSLAVANIHWTTGVFTFISGYSGLIIFGIAFILLLHWLDKKIIKKRIEFR
jgi:high-affinity K+ transport system ATPase subunit B